MAIDQDITNLPTPPSRSDSPSDFSDKADAFLAALPTLQTELNTYADEANTTQVEINLSESNAADSEQTALEWASKTDGQVETVDFSAKAYAISDNLIPEGAAKEWAIKIGGTVDGTEFSAKKYANDAEASASAAASIAGATAWSAGATYDTNDAAIGSDGNTYRSLVDGNLGNDPVTGDGTKWLNLTGTADVTKAELTKTFAAGESASLTLSEEVTTAPVVSVTKEVPQTGVTSNDWDVASDGTNYTLHDTAYSTTLTPSNATGNGDFTLGTGSFAAEDVGKRIVGNGGEAILTAADGSYELQTPFNDDSTIAAGDWSMFALDVESADAGLRIGRTLGSQISSTTAVATWSMENDGTDLGGQYPLSVNGGSFSTESKYGDYSFFAPNDGTSNNYLVREQNDIDITGQSGDGSFSFSAWVRPTQDSLDNSFASIFVLGDTTEYDAFQLLLNNGELDIFRAGGGTASGNKIALSADTWHHVALTFNASDGTVRSYVDGIEGEIATGCSAISSPTSCNILLMQEPDSGNPYGSFSSTQAFFGSIDQVRLFSQALSQEEVKSISIIDQNPSSQDVGFFQIFPLATSTNHTAITTQSIDSEFWTDINSMTADDSVNDGAVYYAVSTDDRTTWSIIDDTEGVRNIVRNNGGTWEYNSDTTYGSETWTTATTNDEFSTLEEAATVTTNRMDATQLNAVSDANHYTLGNDLDLAITLFMADGNTNSPTSDGVSINYDANVLNQGAVLGTDYEFDKPTNDTVRIKALSDENFKVRVL